jgi:hypothetical protein
MPSTSPAQKRLMAAAAHTKGGFGGVPQSVGKDFFAADQAQKHEKGGSIKPVSKETAPATKHGWRRW